MAVAPRIAFLGVGGVGGWLGGRLLQAGKEAAHVALIARGAHGAALREAGLRLRVRAPGGGAGAGGAAEIQSQPGDAAVYASVADALARGAAPFDFVVLGVKTWQVAEAAKEAAPLLAEQGCVVTTQNGVEAVAQAAEAVGPGRVLGGVAKVIAYIAGPGVVEMQAKPAMFHFGEVYGAGGAASHSPASARAERLAAALAGCEGLASGLAAGSAWAMIWEKAVLMCSLGPVGAVCRAPVDQLLCGAPETRQLLRSAMLEVARCATAAGHFDESKANAVVEHALETLTAQGNAQPGITPSTLRDVVTGRPSEINELTGGIVRAGRALGVPTPTHDFILAALLPQERRARGEATYELMGVPGGAPHVAC